MNTWLQVAGVICLICVCMWGLAQWVMSIETNILRHMVIKISRVSVGYDVVLFSEITEVLGYDGKTDLDFWGDQSNRFVAGNTYLIYWRTTFNPAGRGNAQLINATLVAEGSE